MIDPFGRTITYLRVSVTDRCDFRCVYCMAEEMTFLPKKELLTLEELDRVCSAFIRLGVKKLRLTSRTPTPSRTRARGSRVTRVTCRASAVLMVNGRCLQQGARLGCDSSRPCRSLRG
jgi:MoaA/NifB/PqqE/SkfB family radical SAM enzyme